jgi:hypothetical protein
MGAIAACTSRSQTATRRARAATAKASISGGCDSLVAFDFASLFALVFLAFIVCPCSDP